jgi:hypothetical protein
MAELNFFMEELPDSEYSIAVQNLESEALQQFTVFKDLIPELRAKIWRETFPPPRFVRLDWGEWGRWDKYKDQKPSGPLPPVTLYVNRESRYETLRHYNMIYSGHNPIPLNLVLPEKRDLFLNRFVCLNPTREIFAISLDCAHLISYDPNHPPNFPSVLGRMLNAFNRQSPGSVEKIKELQFIEVSDIHINSTSYEAVERDVMRVLVEFKGVKKLVFRCEQQFTDNFLKKKRLEMKKFFIKFATSLQAYKGQYTSGKAPAFDVVGAQGERVFYYK